MSLKWGQVECAGESAGAPRKSSAKIDALVRTASPKSSTSSCCTPSAVVQSTMKTTLLALAGAAAGAAALPAHVGVHEHPLEVVTPKYGALPIPTPSQLKYQGAISALIHFNMATFAHDGAWDAWEMEAGGNRSMRGFSRVALPLSGGAPAPLTPLPHRRRAFPRHHVLLRVNIPS